MLWLHDLLPDGATATGLVDEGGTVINLARRLERSAYGAADRIVVLSRAFTDNLLGKSVPREKIELILIRRPGSPRRSPGRAPPADRCGFSRWGTSATLRGRGARAGV